MDEFVQEKPPWKSVEWIKSSYWENIPEISYIYKNKDMYEIKSSIENFKTIIKLF